MPSKLSRLHASGTRQATLLRPAPSMIPPHPEPEPTS
jgi:hypothetical protein